MNIHRLKDALHEMIDTCTDRELLDHLLQVLQLEKTTHALVSFIESTNPTQAEFMSELEDIEAFEPLDWGDNPLDYPEFESGLN